MKEKKATELENKPTPELKGQEPAKNRLVLCEKSSSNKPTISAITSRVENLKLRIVYKEKPHETSGSFQASESNLYANFNSKLKSEPVPEPKPKTSPSPSSFVCNSEPEPSQKTQSGFSLYRSLLNDETPFKECFVESWSEEDRRSLIKKDSSLRSLINRDHR